jgi:hypothetical protein
MHGHMLQFEWRRRTDALPVVVLRGHGHLVVHGHLDHTDVVQGEQRAVWPHSTGVEKKEHRLREPLREPVEALATKKLESLRP